MWTPVDGSRQVLRARYEADMAHSHTLRVRLSDDAFLIYSPGRGQLPVAQELVPDGSKVWLLAPAAAHTVGLGPWKAAFPGARIVAADAAMERVGSKGGVAGVESLDHLRAALPGHVSVHVPPGSRLGEVWVRVETEAQVYWAICDAFLNFEHVSGGFVARFLKGLYGVKPGLRSHRVFRMGLKSRRAFREWARPLFEVDKAHVVMPCHGEVYDQPDCRERMLQLVDGVR